MKNSEKPTNKAILYTNILLFFCILVCTTSCGLIPGKNGKNNNWWMALAGLVPGTSFPSSGSGVGSGNGGPGSAPAPEGSDLFSISTNYSSAIDDPDTKAEPHAGAAFIAPPEPGHYGTVNLTYPIHTPSGRAGVEPKLSLSYSSTGGDGWLGVGWSLSLGSITRTPEYGALWYDARDTFTWNGQRLVKVAGGTTNENGTYRPEIASEDLVVLRLSNIESGGVWEVLDSTGTKTVFGESTSSRIFNPQVPNQTYSWYLTRTEDKNGNYLQVHYDNSEYSNTRNLYLKEIRYTGNSKSGVSARQYVKFITKQRDDFYVSNAPGFLMKMDKILERIEVGWDNAGKLYDYTPIYETSSDSGRPRLKNIQSSRHTTSPEFEYQSSSRYLIWQNVVNQTSSETEDDPNSTQYFEGDFNGDGISDILFFNPKSGNWKAAEGRKEGGYNFKLYANRYQGYNTQEKVQFFKGNVSGDYNGNGRSDIAFYLPETRDFIVAEHDGRVFQFRSYGRLMAGIPDIFRMEWFPGDYDGNGLSDSVLFDEPTGQWTLMLNKGGSFEFLRFAKKFQNVFRGDYSPDGNLDSSSTNDSSKPGKDHDKVNFLVGDYNGDGRTDISLYDSRSGKWFVGENHRNPNKNDSVYFQMQWKLYKVFTAPEQALFGHDRFSGDFNGDGLSDFLLFDRSNGEWTLGETGDGTINFKIWSRTPQFKPVTRWLQGDFNGDGRTDIGFYSASDGKFWIGESTQNGFRYKVYSDLSYGPDQDRILKTPLPKDEVKIESGKTSFTAASNTKTILLSYKYDGNLNSGKGELVFPGCFTQDDCSNSPELLIYDRKANVFDLKQGNTFTERVNTSLNPEGTGITTLLGGKPDRYTNNTKGEVLFYKKQGNTNQFFVLKHTNGTAFDISNLATFTDTDVTKFDPLNSGTVVDHFENNTSQSVLILDDQTTNGNARFVLSGLGGTKVLTPSGDLTATDLNDLFQAGTNENRQRRKEFSLFSGKFTSTQAQLVIVDRRTTVHKWYLGTINANAIQFKRLTGDIALPITTSDYNSASPAGIVYALTSDGSIVFGKTLDNGTSFYKVKVNATSVSRTLYNAGTVGFSDRFDSGGNPILLSGGEDKLYDLAQSKIVTLPGNVVVKNLDRPDLTSQVYVFRWIQGDYNGDGLTDIGIFHLKEPTWYFALSTGSVPDIIERVKNGIGGIYEFEYSNSTKFDNTGDDDIPDLPTSYRVCTKVTIDDGFSNRVAKSYEYKNGFAFSSFVDGKKETDYFGFSEFTVHEAYGERTTHKYHTTPYSDFLMNRALSGAEKETKIVGNDNNDYGTIQTTYDLKQIAIAPGVTSYLPVTTKIEKFLSGSRTTTQSSDIVISGTKISRKTDTTTDHFTDTVHGVTTTTSIIDFETDDTTNQRRATRSVTFSGSSHEITSLLSYDTRGNVTKRVSSYTGSGLSPVGSHTTEYETDNHGNQTLEKDTSSSPARGTSYTYDNELQQFVTQETKFGGSISFTTTHQIGYGPAFGLPATTTDPNGNKSYFEYDNFGRLIRASADTDDGTRTISTHSYDSSFPLSAKTILPSGTGDPDFASRTYSDGMGRNIYTVKSASNAGYVLTGRLVYDGTGKIIRKGQSNWATSGEIDRFVLHLEERNPTSFEYDPIGRVKKTILPTAGGETSPTTITTTYNSAFETTENHSSGTSKRTVKDAKGEILYVEDFASDGTQAKIGFCYDIAGNRTKKSDLNDSSLMSCPNASAGVPTKDVSGKNQATWSYDAFGKLRAESDPDLGVSSYNYNAFGDLTSQTNAKGVTTTLSYDGVGRITTKNIPEGNIQYVYDSLSGSENALGKLVRVEDSNQNKTFSYDKLGRVKKETRVILATSAGNPLPSETQGPYITETKYDLLGRVTRIDYPEHPISHGRMRACYEYGTAGYISGISVQVNTNGILPGYCNKDIVENITYNEFGQTAGFTLGNGIATSYGYDVKGRMVRLNSSGDVDGSNKVLQDAVYSFNPNNNITRIANNSTDWNAQYDYDYDGIGRLTNAVGIHVETTESNLTKRFQQSYSYAKNGNLTSKRIHDPASGNVTDDWSYLYSNHQVTNIDSSKSGNDTLVMQYDANGNLTRQRDNAKDLTKRISVDSQDRIVQIQDGNNATLGTYWYDEGGFRIRKSSLEPKNNQFANTEILYPSKFYGLEFIEAENVLTSVNNIYLNGVRVAAMNEAGALAYFLTDQVDSVSHVLDDEGKTLSKMQYLPYGEMFVQRGDTNFSPKYNSQELDRESGFYFYNARYYDPGIARFTSADTIIDGEFDTQGWNRFSYVKGNPIGAKDPTGHEIFTVAREYSNTHVPRAAETTGKNIYLVEKNDVKSGLGLSQLAEKALSYEGKNTTNESVKKKMQEILENNPNAFGKNKTLKANSRVEVGKYQGPNPNAPNIFDSMIGSPGKALKALKYGGSYAYNKATGKDNETEEIKQSKTKVNANSEKIFNQYENRLQKLGAETRTKGFPFNLYGEEGKPAFKPDVNSNGNLMFKGYQGEVITTNEKAAKINK
ncbi:SpvB/TcaC N-terminal domain-containing protein [Leptospira alstonii]|uniref:Virulence plasmid 65kDa B protein n=2 Tax=Leptospira alstonii TaxID=28452 RepID=M6CWY1_9LEPT|nr:SpvB/TcaC N-terminal domain-containing protein [Leptospira alstonii]EMJ93443.1 virulence plasmid 65kDa B protein [Leptospira alstonii serovar Sichuan str. 79601]EQA80791.1 virulence plasmid 65kDa B protein [Leptospira alstonii serovar Pingchang str. 80-412]